MTTKDNETFIQFIKKVGFWGTLFMIILFPLAALMVGIEMLSGIEDPENWEGDAGEF